MKTLMMKTLMKTLMVKTVLAIGLLLIPMTIHAETTPDAQKWIDALAGFYDKAPFQVEIAGTMTMPMPGVIEGVILVKDQAHQQARFSLTMGDPGAGQGMKMDMLAVSDGTIAWTEVNSPMGKQVMKMSLEEARQKAEAGGMPSMGSSMDPLSMTDHLASIMDFKVTDMSAGKVTLEGTLKDSSASNMDGMGNMPIGGITLVLDEKTGFLEQIVLGGDPPTMTLSLKNLMYLKASDLEAGAFEYTPPEGVQVMDTAQLQAIRGQQGDGR